LERCHFVKNASVIGLEGDDVGLHFVLGLKELIDLGLQGERVG
jgi:hypothetical protein